MEKSFRIGEIAKITGSAQSAMRFYEERGIIEPDKDRDNRYRLYGPADSCRLLVTKLYRSFGIPISELPSMLSCPEYGAAADSFRARGESIDAEMRRLSLVRDELGLLEAEIRRGSSILGKPFLDLSPGYYRIANISGGKLLTDPANDRATRRWMRYLPLVRYSLFVPREALGGAVPFSCEWGFSLDADKAEAFGELASGPISFVPPSECLRVYLERRSAGDLAREEIASLLSELARRGLSVAGPAHGRLLCLRTEGGEERYLINFCIPVKK
jgi:DNA-binding transcriptional MerR regulator